MLLEGLIFQLHKHCWGVMYEKQADPHNSRHSGIMSFQSSACVKSVTGHLWEEEIGNLADAACRRLAQGLLTNALYDIICQPHNGQHAVWLACITTHNTQLSIRLLVQGMQHVAAALQTHRLSWLSKVIVLTGNMSFSLSSVLSCVS